MMAASVGCGHVMLAIPDALIRQRLKLCLSGMRWRVAEASGGAEAIVQMDEVLPEALVMDSWLPDLEAGEFAVQMRAMYPTVDVVRLDGGVTEGGAKSPRRHELLHALRELETELTENTFTPVEPVAAVTKRSIRFTQEQRPARVGEMEGLVGKSAVMRELQQMIRMVAPRSTRVLIEGETGTGKEVVARTLHKLSTRAALPFAVLNCAAIPEALLEAELFGHTRGAFTGAVQSRVGRIEAANGGTLFLDEIGEMPLPLQAKMLRFLESGELQRVGDNEMMKVDVRVLAATHQPLEQRSEEGTFRLDLYHRLAVFPIEVPALRDRLEDMPLLAEHLLARLGKQEARKHVSIAAMVRLQEHHWPGNVRELGHVLERAAILSGDDVEIGPEAIRVRRRER